MKERFASIRLTPEANEAMEKLQEYYLSHIGVPIKINTLVNVALVKLADNLDLLIKERKND